VLSRLDRDILSLRGVRQVLIFEGVNDIGTANADEESQKIIGDRLIAGYKQIATRVHACGIRIFAATITPFGRRENELIVDAEEAGVTSYSHPEREKTRQRVNDWIRNSGTFDRVIDFDRVLRDDHHVSALAKRFDSGDRLHPNLEAFHALADAFPLGIFTADFGNWV
jgi:lysophospholipase L1-like esterase